MGDATKTPLNKARYNIPNKDIFDNDDYIFSLIKRIDTENIECYIRTINLPGLGLGQKMGLEHKVLEVYEKDGTEYTFLFSVGGKQILDLEYIDNKLAFFTDINDSNYYLEFPDQFLQYDEFKREDKFLGVLPQDDNLFIDSFDGKKLFDYLSALERTGKHNYLEDNIGMTIAHDLYKVDDRTKKPNVFKKSGMEKVTIDKTALQKLLFILLVNKNKFTINGVIGNYDEADGDPTLQALKELEERGVYATNREVKQAFYSEYDNKYFFVDIFEETDIKELNAMINKYCKEIINAMRLLFNKGYIKEDYTESKAVYKILIQFLGKDKTIKLQNRLVPLLYKDKYDDKGNRKQGQLDDLQLENIINQTLKTLANEAKK